VRQDPYAKANPLVVEQEKDARLRGFYIHPELYGAPPEKQILEATSRQRQEYTAVIWVSRGQSGRDRAIR
jgi:hypothetical protein